MSAVLDTVKRIGEKVGFAKPAEKVAPQTRTNVLNAKLAERLKARYDAALTTDENQKHWSYADGLSAAAANSPDVRKKLRDRARYEFENNPYLNGMIRTMANEVVGTGPRLQMNSGDTESDRAVEKLWDSWSKAVNLDKKLRVMESVVWKDGESFGLMSFNGGLRHPIKLDLRLYEAEQVARPWPVLTDPQQTDGIILDDWGNPIAYTLLRHHPGDLFEVQGVEQDFDTIRAEFMIHRFICERPGQVRGVPGILPSLPLGAQLRRYTLSVIAAAETAADHALLLKTQASPENPDDLEPLDLIDLEKRMAMTLPKGWEPFQMRAEQPTTMYGDFKAEIINEMARPMSMPFNIAASNSKDYNYSSGRLDHQTFFKFVSVRRKDTEDETIERLLGLFWEEAQLRGFLPPQFNRFEIPDHTWAWDGQEEIDPLKESRADIDLVEAGLKSEANYFAKRGRDWEQENAQIARELGITVNELRELKRQKRFEIKNDVDQFRNQQETEDSDD